jgi:hypothetical protein
MGRIMSQVLSALIASRVAFSARFLSRLAESGAFPVDPANGPLFLEAIVQQYWLPDPKNVTVCNEGLVFTGGLGQRRLQVACCRLQPTRFAHAADLFRQRPEAVQDAAPPWAT